MKYLFWVYAAFSVLPGSLCWTMAHGHYYPTFYFVMTGFWVLFFFITRAAPVFIDKFI